METLVSRSIVHSYFEKLENHLQVDAAIVGGGPSGKGIKTALFERKLAPGGGMWGGAMMFNQIVVQKELAPLLDELEIQYQPGEKDTLLLDSVHATSALTYRATQAGAVIFNCYSVEDLILKEEKVAGIVVNWAPVHREGLHVDPLMITAKAVVDGTGHPCELTSILSRKNGVHLDTENGKIMGERSMDVLKGEETTLENTGEVYPGLYICGMAANGVRGSFRMGPIFGGMLLSGQKTAELISRDLQS